MTERITITRCAAGFRAVLRDGDQVVHEETSYGPVAALELLLDMVTDGGFAGRPITKLEAL